MATTKFKTTMDAFQGGVKKLPIDKAVANIEGWEDYLHKHDGEGVKAVLADLGKLKKLLQADEVDSEAVNKLLEKVGKDTVKVAGKEDNAEGKHIRELGEALTSASEDEEEEDEDADEEEDEDADDIEDDELVDDDEDVEDDDDTDEEDDEDEGADDEDDDDEEDEDVEDEPKPAAKKAAKAPAKKSAAKKSK